MKTELFNFEIPKNLIAQYPAQRRSDSRLLVYNKEKDHITDSYTKNISEFLTNNDFLVFNNSRVIPARLKITKQANNRKGELLILRIISPFEIEVLVDKTKKYPINTEVILPEHNICRITDDLQKGIKILKADKPIFSIEYFEKNGFIPLPPYIIRKNNNEDIDKERYQTIFSKDYGSSAAPTAGLHFDENIFSSLDKKDIQYSFVSLHVGLGTFQPIYSDNIEDHKIHKEEYFIDKNQADKINMAINNNKRIIPVGTTSLRTLETAYNNNMIKEGKGKSELYIYPSYNFKIIGGLITNFHTPKSSLLVLVSALIGREKILEIYDYAIKKKYRFFSYGDAMLIV